MARTLRELVGTINTVDRNTVSRLEGNGANVEMMPGAMPPSYEAPPLVQRRPISTESLRDGIYRTLGERYTTQVDRDGRVASITITTGGGGGLTDRAIFPEYPTAPTPWLSSETEWPTPPESLETAYFNMVNANHRYENGAIREDRIGASRFTDWPSRYDEYNRTPTKTFFKPEKSSQEKQFAEWFKSNVKLNVNLDQDGNRLVVNVSLTDKEGNVIMSDSDTTQIYKD